VRGPDKLAGRVGVNNGRLGISERGQGVRRGSGQRPGNSKQGHTVKGNMKHPHTRQSLHRARARQNVMAGAAWRGGFVLSRFFLLRSLQQWQRMK